MANRVTTGWRERTSGVSSGSTRQTNFAARTNPRSRNGRGVTIEGFRESDEALLSCSMIRQKSSAAERRQSPVAATWIEDTMPIVAPSRDAIRTASRSTQLGLATAACWAMVGTLVGWFVWVGHVEGLLAVVGSALLLIAFWGHPRLALVVWMLSLVMLPIWISIDFFASVPAHCVVAILAIAATMRRTRPSLTSADTYFAVFLAACFAAVLFGGSSAGLWAEILIQWGIPYMTARVLLLATGIRFTVNVIAVIFGLIGALAVLELLLTWHPFVGWHVSSTQFEYWHAIQARNGTDRSEWAFGHSIALGGSLALSIPFITRSSFSAFVKVVLLISVSAGIAATASRGAFIAAAFTALVCLLYVARQRIVRTATLLLTLMVAFLVTSSLGPLVQSMTRGTTQEEQWSYDHRDDLYSTYLSAIEWFGKSPLYLTDGTGYYSTDSALLRVGLQFGWVVLVLAVIPLVLTIFRVVAGRASIGEIAIVGQLPLLATVALITQYQSLIFFAVGIAVQMTMAKGVQDSENFDDDRRSHAKTRMDPHPRPTDRTRLLRHDVT